MKKDNQEQSTILNRIIKFFKKWVNPSGTITRKEYLIGIIVYFILVLIIYETFKSNSMIFMICAIIMFFPYYSLASKRLHDVGYEKVFWIILGSSMINPLILIISCLLMSSKNLKKK